MEEIDGVDHINIFSRGATELGRKLSNFAFAPIEIPEHGKFYSIEGYWYWLTTGLQHDELRTVIGFDAKRIGRTFDTVDIDQILFKKYICTAMKLKLEQHPDIVNLLKDSTLPFRHYYVFGGKRVEAGFEWIVEEWEKLRKNLP